MVTIDYDGVSTHLMIILMIELGIWVILACPNFIRSGDTFSRHILMVFQQKLMIILMIELGIWVMRNAM